MNENKEVYPEFIKELTEKLLKDNRVKLPEPIIKDVNKVIKLKSGLKKVFTLKNKAERLKEIINDYAPDIDQRPAYDVENDLQEILGLMYLLTDNSFSLQHKNNLEGIKSLLFCMDKDNSLYRGLSEDKTKLADKLIANSEIVDIVLMILFQWFGTHVGFLTIQKLLKDMSEIKKRV